MFSYPMPYVRSRVSYIQLLFIASTSDVYQNHMSQGNLLADWDGHTDPLILTAVRIIINHHGAKVMYNV